MKIIIAVFSGIKIINLLKLVDKFYSINQIILKTED